MEAVFLKLVNMSITASYLVLAVIALRLVFRKAPKWIFCVLWGMVALRLICPFSLESVLSLIPAAPMAHIRERRKDRICVGLALTAGLTGVKEDSSRGLTALSITATPLWISGCAV